MASQESPAPMAPPAQLQHFVSLQMRPSFNIFGDTAQSAELHRFNMNTHDSYLYSHEAKGPQATLISRKVAEVEAAAQQLIFVVACMQPKALITNPNVISLCDDPDFDPDRTRFFKRGHNLPGQYPEDTSFRTVGQVWNQQQDKMAAFSRASRAAGTHAALSVGVGGVPGVRGAATARELKLGSDQRRAQTARILRPEKKASKLAPSVAGTKLARAVRDPFAVSVGAAGMRADEFPDSYHLAKHLKRTQSLHTNKGAGAGTIRSSRGPSHAPASGRIEAGDVPRPLYPYGASSAFPYAPYDFRPVIVAKS